jgi:hypothetical protein
MLVKLTPGNDQILQLGSISSLFYRQAFCHYIYADLTGVKPRVIRVKGGHCFLFFSLVEFDAILLMK